MQQALFKEQVFGMGTETLKIKVAELYYGVRNNLQGHLEAVIPSDGIKIVPYMSICMWILCTEGCSFQIRGQI